MIWKNNTEEQKKQQENVDNTQPIILDLFNKYKTIIIAVGILTIILIVLLLIASPKESNVKDPGGEQPSTENQNYLTLNGSKVITLYRGTNYVEPGYEAYNSKNEDLSQFVEIESTLDTETIGTYEIKYKLYDIVVTRKIEVIANPNEKVEIVLKPSKDTNKDINVYLLKGEEYVEPGYDIINSFPKELEEEVKVEGEVDTSKTGTYELKYTITDPNGVLVSTIRNVIVTDIKITLTKNTEDYTKNNITIRVQVEDEYFDYFELPNKNKVYGQTYSYTVSENGTYTFTAYSKKGFKKTSSIEIKNIDKEAPTGSCTINHTQSENFISIVATDKSGIKNYVYSNKTYTTNKIKISSNVNSAKIIVYDNVGNKKDITCTMSQGVYINNVQKDGVIVTITTKKVNSDIAGYYFSYTSNRPSKDTGGYIATDKSTIDVVRLPGTTYIWVEGKNGQISAPKTINIDNDALLITTKSGYKILEGTKLSTYLSNNGWSINELNSLMARSVRAAGLYTKEAAATSAVVFQTVLAQKYKIKLPYWNGGKGFNFGANGDWGKYEPHYAEHFDKWYYYYGLDCSGFTTWAYVNAGYNVYSTPNVSKYPAYWWGYKSVEFSKANGDIGDFIINSGHIKLIIGKTDTAFITAEARGTADGMVVSLHEYSKPSGYDIQKGEQLMSKYNKYNKSEIPTGV